MSELVAHPGPDWVLAEMPAGYQNRLSEIQRLIADLHEMGRFARLVYEVGPALAEAMRDIFAALKLETERTSDLKLPGAGDTRPGQLPSQ